MNKPATYQVRFVMNDDPGTTFEVTALREYRAVEAATELYRQRRGDGPDHRYAIEDVRKLTLIAPPTHAYRRPRRWETFERLFQPIELADGSIVRDGRDVPKDADARFWWTLLDCDGKSILATGFHFVNRLGYVQCRHGWDGEWNDHPE